MGEYIPVAPTNDEARKHNENLPIKSALEQISICERDDFPCAVRTQYDDAMFALVQTRPVNEPQYFVAKLTVPGMGGVFNVVNLHVYHYAGIGQRSDSELQANNPVKYTDPDGRIINLSSNGTAGNGLKQSQTDASIVKRTAGLFLIGLGLLLDYGSPLITGFIIYSSGGTAVAAAPAINAGSKALGKTLGLGASFPLIPKLLVLMDKDTYRKYLEMQIILNKTCY